MREQRGFRPATLIVAGAAALLCVTFAVLTPGAANAIGTWTPPVSVSGTGPGLSATPQVTTDPSGNTFAVWIQNANTSNSTVDAAMRPAGSSTWTSATVLSQINANNFGVSVVSDPHGNVTAMWYHGSAVESATRPAGTGSVWGSVQTISPSAGNSPGIPPSIVSDTNGNLSAAWQASAGAWNVIQVSSRSAGTSSWSTPTTISLGGSNQDNNFASLAYSPNGDLMAVWQHSSAASINSLQASTRAAGSSSWSAITTIALGSNFNLQLVFDPSGNATVLYTDANNQVAAASLPAGSSTWTTPAALTTGAVYAPTTALVTDSHGMLTAAWNVLSPPDRVLVQTATRPAGVTSAWTTPTTLTPNSSGAESVTPQLAVDPNGNVTCVWLNYVTNVIQSAAKPAGRNNWSPVVDVSSLAPYNPNSWRTPVTSDPSGMITAVFISTNQTIMSSTAAGLSLTPANQSLLGTVGVPLTGSNAFTANGFTSAVSYTVSPALPAGLVIDPSTGVISGTPSVSQAATSYVVSAEDSVGFVSTATVQITVGAASSTTSLATTGTDTLQPATAGAIALISGGLLLGAVSLRRRRSVS